MTQRGQTVHPVVDIISVSPAERIFTGESDDEVVVKCRSTSQFWSTNHDEAYRTFRFRRLNATYLIVSLRLWPQQELPWLLFKVICTLLLELRPRCCSKWICC